MDIKIAFSEDPALVLSSAGGFLASQPVLHNLILSLLRARLTLLGGDGSGQGRRRDPSVTSDFSSDSHTHGIARSRCHGGCHRGSWRLPPGSERGCGNGGQLLWAVD